LIVEDNAIQALSLEMFIKQLGFDQVRKTHSAKDAMEIVESFSPELMLVDINLNSEITGIDIVKKAQELGDVKVIYISGNSDILHKESASDTEFISYLIKPVEFDSLRELLSNKQILSK
jgi:response regulator of citrate/malate metabolism